MLKARASGSKVYLYFMKKGQAGETPHSAEFLFFSAFAVTLACASGFKSTWTSSVYVWVGSFLGTIMDRSLYSKVRSSESNHSHFFLRKTNPTSLVDL